MKKDIINNQKQYNHNHHGNTQNIHVCNNVAANRLNIKVAASTAASSVTAPISTKNVRSSSLPLKILSNSNSNRFLSNSNSNGNSNKLSQVNQVHSWTDFTFLSKHKNNFDCFNLNGLYFNYKYRQISRSDRFLDFMEYREQQADEKLKFNSNSSISSLSSSSPSNFFSDSYPDNQNKFSNNQNKLEEEDEYESSPFSSSSSSPTPSPPNKNNQSSNVVDSSSLSTPNPSTTATPCNTDQIETVFSHSRTFNTNESRPQEPLKIEEIVQTSNLSQPEKNEKDLQSSETDLNANLPTVVDDVEEVKSNDLVSSGNINEANNNNKTVTSDCDFMVALDDLTPVNIDLNDKLGNEITLNKELLPEILIESTRLDDCSVADGEDCSKSSLLNTNIDQHDELNDEEVNNKNDTLITSSSNDVLIGEKTDDDEEDEDEDDEDLSYRNFIPKKSCLKVRNSSSELSSSDYSSGFSNVTSSPLISPSSPSQCSNTSNLWSSASNTTATTSSELANSTFNSSKKRVLFADDAGKELFTVRTMSEPSNCPPKLTSKIVQYFLNREFSHQNAQCGSGMNNKQVGTENYNNYASLSGHQLLNNQFFSTTRSYDYGISALNYTNDVNKVSGSLAVYSLNFQQPAGDYLKFRQRIEKKYVSLENVLLNGFQVNGTIRVKNIEFHKNVFIRCSFNKWASFEDYQAVYVPCDYFSSVSSLSPTMSSSSISASFCGQYQQPVHKEYDTFRFEFQLPKTVDKSKFQSESENNCDRHATASIQFCICYQSGTGYDLKEFWDSNEGNNYEILQYVIDLENLKPKKHVSIASAASAASSQLKNNNKSKSNHFKYIESNLSSNNKSFNSFHETSVYY